MTWIGIHPTRRNRMLAVIRTRGLYLSDDTGQSWHATNAPVPPGGVAFVRDQPDMILVGGLDHDGVLISDDAGQTWRPLGVRLEPAPRAYALVASADALVASADAHLGHGKPDPSPNEGTDRPHRTPGG